MSAHDAADLARVLEAVLFASPRPVSAADLLDVLREAAGADDGAAHLGDRGEDDIESAIADLEQQYGEQRRGFRIERVAGGYQITTSPDCAPWVRVFLDEGRSSRLSRPALETLAIVAYRQPVTRAEVEAIRGVNADGVISVLLERGLIRIAGRSEGPGRPFLYGTTRDFLEHFRLGSLEDLPEGDVLRRSADDLSRRQREAEESARSAAPAPEAAPDAADEPDPATQPAPATGEEGGPQDDESADEPV